MRFVIYGAGAIGGVVGSQLHRADHDVTLVARGDHFVAIRDQGLVFENPVERARIEIPVVDDIRRAGVEQGTVVLLTVKSQDTAGCVASLRQVADPTTPVVCLQNGVENERTAIRLFPNVYGASVQCQASFLEPGSVRAYSAPTTGILDVGRYPEGVDDTAIAVAAALEEAMFVSEARPDIMRWKYRKLIRNLRNAIEAVCGVSARDGRIGELTAAEGERVLTAAGIDVASAEEDKRRRGNHLNNGPVAGSVRPGGSVWQSLSRGVGTVETDYLSGHIAMLGRIHGVPTPVNDLLQRLAAELAVTRRAPATLTENEFLTMLEPYG